MADRGTDEHLITDPSEIARLLSLLYRQHASITVNFHGHSQHYASMILDIDRNKQVFFLDELNPPSGHKRALAGETFSIRASTRGLSTFFNDCQLLGVSDEEKGAIYEVALPRWVRHDQKREAFRARVLASMTAKTLLFAYERQQAIPGRLLDLSSGGCNLVCEGSIDRPFRNLEIFEELTLDVKDFERSITLPAEIRRLSFDESKQLTHCGLRFINVDGATQAEVDRLVMFLQREALRLDSGRD